MPRTSTEIQDLDLGPTDRVFFHLFNNFSVFIKDPLQKQINLVASLSDPQKLLRYALHSKRFYEVTKAPQLLSHWKEILDDKIEDHHPFDELLIRHCDEMIHQAMAENNLALAEAYKKHREKFSQNSDFSKNTMFDPKLEQKSGRNLPCNF